MYALYEPAHGRTRRTRPRTNYASYIQKITGHQRCCQNSRELSEKTGVKLVVTATSAT